MRTINFCNCLELNSFGVELLFSKSRSEIIRFFFENNIPTNILTKKQIIVRSKLLFLDVDFFISCQFNDDKLFSVTISPDTTLEGKPLLSQYKRIQKALENELGYPCNRWNSIFYLLSPESSSLYWLKDGVRIEHSLLNRFGLEETINIKLYLSNATK